MKIRVALLLITLAVILAHAIQRFEKTTPDSDNRQNYFSAVQLFHRATFQSVAGLEAKPSFYREPGYPLFLALSIPVIYFGKPTPSLEDFQSVTAHYDKLARANYFIFIVTLLVLFAIAYNVSGSPYVAYAVMVFTGFSPPLLERLPRLNVEPFVGLLILVLGAAISAQRKRPRPKTAFFIGTTLAVLILSRAIFIYFIPLALGIAFLTSPPRRASLLYFTLPLLLLVGGWCLRNHYQSGRAFLAERGGFVLYERTYFLDKGLTIFRPYLLAWTPLASTENRLEKTYGYDDGFLQHQYWSYADRERQALNQRLHSSAQADQMQEREAIQKILAHPFLFIGQIPLFAYRGIFFWTFGGSLALFFGSLGYLTWGWIKRAELSLFSAGIFSFAFCAGLTTNTPRYHVALVPLMMLATGLLLQRVSSLIFKLSTTTLNPRT